MGQKDEPAAGSTAATGAPAAAPAATGPTTGDAAAAAPPLVTETSDGQMRGMVRLIIDSEPSGAEVFRQGDSQLLGRTPYSVKQAPEPGYATFELRLAGYQPELISLRTDKSGESRATLRRLGATSPPAGGKSGGAAGKKKDPVPAIKDSR
jgi:hypothetical protein